MWVSSRIIKDSVKEIVRDALSDAEKVMQRIGELTKLREEIETLKIEKGRREEEYSKRDREIEHKIGLERKRQEFEVAQSKREATVSIREENLKADRDRFESQMKFHDERFTQEVGYLKDMITQMMTRLPSAEILSDTSPHVTVRRR